MGTSIVMLFPNHLRVERSALVLTPDDIADATGIPRHLYDEMEAGRILPQSDELARITAALGGIEPARIYAFSLLNTIGDERLRNIPSRAERSRKPGQGVDYARWFRQKEVVSHLLTSPQELAWLDTYGATHDVPVDVFLNMSCRHQLFPNVMIDVKTVLDALGVTFAAGVGATTCCGVYYRRNGDFDRATRLHEANVARQLVTGAKTAAHMCVQCVNAYTEISQRRAVEFGAEQKVENIQLLSYVIRRIEELGDDVPWRHEVPIRALTNGTTGQWTYSLAHEQERRDAAAIVKLTPGAELLGFMDRTSIDAIFDTEPGVATRPRPKTREEVEAYRAELAEYCRSLGADTVVGGFGNWGYNFSSETVQVIHPISLLAEALGGAAPDRAQAASRLGDANAIVDQLRPIWSAWGMSEEDALETARANFDPAYATIDDTVCGCGQGGGGHASHPELISVDVVRGVAPASKGS